MVGDVIRLWLCKLLLPEGYEAVRKERVVAKGYKVVKISRGWKKKPKELPLAQESNNVL
jgi:hypothetical protein